MTIKALTLDEVEDYVCKLDTGDEKTIWSIGVIDAVMLAQIEDDLLQFKVKQDSEDTETKLNLNKRNLEVVKHGLKGVTGFKDDTGEDIKLKMTSAVRAGQNVKLVHEQSLRLIPTAILKELAEKILEANNLTEDEVGNSD